MRKTETGAVFEGKLISFNGIQKQTNKQKESFCVTLLTSQETGKFGQSGCCILSTAAAAYETQPAQHGVFSVSFILVIAMTTVSDFSELLM